MKQNNQTGIYGGFILEWVLDDCQLSNTEYDELFYDSSTQITLRGNRNAE